ncbi:MAG: CotH kinase family protein [Saprospiraceae bacterium]|nr:CotH kinase family protein [Saprospiraceae bacterium]
MKKITVAFCLVLFWGLAAGLQAQNLPSHLRLDSDRHLLVTGDQPTTGLYDSATIRTIYLEFPQANYWSLLTSNYASKTDLPAKMTVDGTVYDSVGVRFKGQTSYNQNQNSQKKSFNITTDLVHPGQELLGYKTLNLNNSFQDPSFLREVFYQHQIRRHIPAASSNFVQLYINGQNWGIYPNVQQLNKDFLKEWFFSNDGINWRADRPDGTVGGGGGPGGPGWGDGTAALNYLGADSSDYQTYYTLKSSGVDHPWDYLTTACNALNNTSVANLPTVLPNYFDVDRTLWHLASEIAFSDDDSYVYKGKMDYYVYYEPETGRITPLEYDGNSAMEANLVNWSPFYNETKVNYPLLNKVLAVPAWRQRYLAHMRTIISEELNPTRCNAMLDNYKLMIDALVKADPKKQYTNAQFESEITVLKNFVNNRRTNLLNNAEVKQVAPVITSADCRNATGAIWGNVLAGEEPLVTAQVSSASGIFAVNLYYSNQLTGNFSVTSLYDDGQHQDGAAADGLFSGTLPAQTAGTWVRFYIEAVANTTARSVSYLPAGAEHDVYVYQVQPVSLLGGPVVINELMATNATTAADEQGDFDDWIELYNNSGQQVDLSGYYLSDNPANLAKYEIPAGIFIPANGYRIFWADEDGLDGPYHCNFKLAGTGEVLYLLKPDLTIVDSVTFGLQTTDKGFARVPNGTGNFVIQNPTYNANNNTTAIVELGGTGHALQVFPNPASGTVTVKTNPTDKGQALQVWDMTGRPMYQAEASQTDMRFSVESWPSGVYSVQLGTVVSRLVVQR